MAAITSNSSGAWGTGGTWVGGVAPGSGDTAIIASGHVVTVTTNITIGTSDVAGVAAVTMGGLTSQVVVGSGKQLTLRGDVLVKAGFGDGTPQLLMNAGSILEFDSSAAASPATTNYKVGPDSAFFWGFFRANGTAGSRCVVRSNAGGGNGFFSSNGFTQGGTIIASYTDFLLIGDVVNPGFAPYFTAFTDLARWDVQYCTFTGCGSIANAGTNIAANSIMRHNHNVHVSSAGGFPFWLSTTVSLTTGLREVIGNVFDGIYGTDGSSVGTPQDFTIEDNLFYGAVFAGIVAWASFARNLWRGVTSFQSKGSIVDCILFIDSFLDPSDHVPDAPPFNFDFIRNIIDGSCLAIHISDISDGIVSSNGSFTNRVNHNILLPAGDGRGCSALVAQRYTDSNVTMLIENNTVSAGVDAVEIVGSENASGATTGTFKNNIIWDSISNRGVCIQDTGHGTGPTPTPQSDFFNPSAILNNCRYNLKSSVASLPFLTNQGNSYIGKFSVTPGSSDLTVDPQFVDTSRNIATFDTAFLGHIAGSTWASHANGDNFVVGDIVSDHGPSYYANAVINYRCIASHTKSTVNSEPGVGSAWHTYWEFATLNSIRVAILAGTLITDTTIGAVAATYIVALTKWIRAGYAPRNQSLKNAGSDGTDIGAVPVVTPVPALTSALHHFGFGYREP